MSHKYAAWLDVVLGAEPFDYLIVELLSIIHDKGIRHSKTHQNTVVNEILNVSFGYFDYHLYLYPYLYPFFKVFTYKENEFTLARRSLVPAKWVRALKHLAPIGKKAMD